MRMSTLDVSTVEVFDNIIIYLYRYGNLVIYFLGNIGNFLSIFVLSKKPWRKNVCAFYFLVSLLVNCMYLSSVILTTSLIKGYNIDMTNLNNGLCKTVNYLAIFFSTLSPTVLICGSIDRLLISSQNVDIRLYSSKRLAYFSIGLSAIFWACFNLHVLIKVGVQQISADDQQCLPDLSTSLYMNFFNYSLTIINCMFCFSMIVLSALALRNVRHGQVFSHQQQRQVRSMKKKDLQLLRCLFVHDIIYIFVSIIPTVYSVYRTVEAATLRQTSLDNVIVNFLSDLFTFVYFTFYCSSFFIFFTVIKSFRSKLKRMMMAMFGVNVPITREEDNRDEHAEQNNQNVNLPIVSTIIIRS